MKGSLKLTSKEKLAIASACAVLAVLGFEFWRVAKRDDVYGVDGPATQAAVLKVIPIGSKIDFAKDVMQSKGFNCVMKYKMRYSGDDPAGGRRQLEYGPRDFLWCDTGDHGFPIAKRWQVIFVEHAGDVESVAVGVGLTGP